MAVKKTGKKTQKKPASQAQDKPKPKAEKPKSTPPKKVEVASTRASGKKPALPKRRKKTV